MGRRIKEFPGVKGFSKSNLSYIRQWYTFYSRSVIVPQVVGEMQGVVLQYIRQIPWGHNREIVSKCQNVSEALFYVQRTIQNNWSRAILLAQIESKLYERQGKAIHNFQLTLPEPQADLTRDTLKNPYNFDFLTLGQEAKEHDLETALTTHIQKFLLELGQGFAYMGRQFRINVAGDDFYPDLLFYHTRLRCYVVVELKATAFQPEYAGKLNFYLNVVNAQLRHPLGVAEYQIINAVPDNLKGELPSIEELERELGAIPGEAGGNKKSPELTGLS